MVSLSGLEEEILKLSKQKGWIKQEGDKPVLAISVKEKETDKPLLILITTFECDKEAVNSALRERGFEKIAKIHEVRRIEEIPLTGTGKTQYRLLDEMVVKDETKTAPSKNI
jgi:long-chain-fatty-acid--[acyl-carrier-protein] ligase